MLSYMRTYVISEFLVYGEMIHPGTISSNPNFSPSYEFFWSIGNLSKPNSYNGYDKMISARADQLEHSSDDILFNTSSIIYSSWRQIVSDNKELYDTVHIIANVSNNQCTFNYSFNNNYIFIYSNVYCHHIHMKPNEESTWGGPSGWQAGPFIGNPTDGLNIINIHITLGSHEVYVLRLSHENK